MEQSELLPLTGEGGWRGRVAREQTTYDGEPHITVFPEGADPILVPAALLSSRDGSCYLPLTRQQLLAGSTGRQSQPGSTTAARSQITEVQAGDELVVPVAREVVEVSTRRWETGGARIHMEVREREEVVDQPLTREEVRVERVPVHEYVEAAPPVRQEGGTTIIPVLEEVLVVEKRLLLKEEVRITKRTFEAHEPQSVVVRSEEPRIERLGPEQPSEAQREAA